MITKICDICGEPMAGSPKYVLKKHTWDWGDHEVTKMDICKDCMTDLIKLIRNYRPHGSMQWVPKDDAKEVIE